MSKKGWIELKIFQKLYDETALIIFINDTFYTFTVQHNTSYLSSFVFDILQDLQKKRLIVVPKEEGIKLQQLRSSDLNLAMVLLEGMRITYKKETKEFENTLKKLYEKRV
tara:strand:+ start:2608 stop:2937 length:330 start_codon:yes stop_codon:yes gene_type:complete